MPQAKFLSGMHDKHLSHNAISNIVTVFDESVRVLFESHVGKTNRALTILSLCSCNYIVIAL
jgi:hypothetical protein